MTCALQMSVAKCHCDAAMAEIWWLSETSPEDCQGPWAISRKSPGANPGGYTGTK